MMLILFWRAWSGSIFLVILWATVQNVHAAQQLFETNESAVQRLFLLDTSESMNWPVRFRQKIAWAREGLIAYVKSLSAETKVGLQTFGGDCRTTNLLVPIQEKNSDSIFEALEKISPSGATPLAYALEQSIQAFDWHSKGKKVLVVLTDGAESCGGDVCTAVRKLRQQSLNIRVDVVGLLLDESARGELACLTELTGGSFVNVTSDDLPNLGNIFLSLGSGILKRIIALVLGLGAIISWSKWVHRILVTTFLIRKGLAATVASVVSVMALSFFVSLLFQPVTPLFNLIPLPLVAIGVGIAIFTFLFQRETVRNGEISLLLLLSLTFLVAEASWSYGGELQIQHQDQPTQIGQDHVVAIDQSGSMKDFWRNVQSQTKAYITSQVRDGDTFSLFAFTDHTNLLGMWHVDGEADRDEIRKRINELHPIQSSSTVFSQLLETIVQHVKLTARLDHQQIVLIVSDGKSDPPDDFHGQDVPFRAIGERIVRIDGYFIAIVGGDGFDPVVRKGVPLSSSPTPHDTEVLRSWKAFFSPTLAIGGKSSVLARLSPSLFGRWPEETPFLLSVTSTSPLPKEIDLSSIFRFDSEHLAIPPLHLSLREGKGEITGVIPLKEVPKNIQRGTVAITLPRSFQPSVLEVPLEVRVVAWSERFSWLLWTVGIVLSGGFVAGVVQVIPRRFGTMWVTDSGGDPVALPRGGVVTIGGPGGIGPEDLPVVARLIRGQGTKVFLEPTGLPDTEVKLNGADLPGKCPYTFGLPFVCIAGDKKEQITITRTRKPRLAHARGDLHTAHSLLGDDVL